MEESGDSVEKQTNSVEIRCNSVEAKKAQSPSLRGFCCQMAIIHGFFHSLCATQWEKLESLRRGYPLRRQPAICHCKVARQTCTVVFLGADDQPAHPKTAIQPQQSPFRQGENRAVDDYTVNR